jgi:outer membrane receptor protein involved in Fe transport
MRNLCVLLLALLSLACLVQGQTSRGTVTGIVTDPSAAVVPGATVELVGNETGVKRETKTNEAGLYRFDAVDLGSHRLTVTAAGFRTFVIQNISVAAGIVTSQDARLEVGQAQSIIEVSGEATALQYEAPVRGGSINLSSYANLPMAGRDPTQFALTLPGVVTNRYGFGVGTFSVNGSRGRSNNFMVDGVDNNDVSVAGQLVTITNPDAVAEVSVQTSNFDAEYGRAGGAVVNTITRSGSNDLHGSAMYLLDVTNDEAITSTQALNAEIVKRGKPFYGIEQWYGFTLGGPIKRNRTFFFGAFQDQRQRSMNTQNLVTLTANGRATLNALFPRGTNPRVDLYNAVTGGVNATSQTSMVAMGDGRPSVEVGTAIWPYAYKYLDRQFLVRIDHQISPHDQLSGRYLRDKQNSPQGGASPFFPGFSTSYQYPSQNVVLTETHIFSPTTTNELRLPYNRANLDYPIDTENPLGKTMPLYTIGGGLTPIGVQTNLPQGRTVNNYGLQDTVSHVRATHSFRFGLTLNQQRARQFAPIRERGEIVYTTTTGYSNFANFIDDYSGNTGSVQRDFGSARYYPRYTRQAYFAQDRWRVTKDLTLTLGVRYEYFGTPMNCLYKASWSGLFNVDPVTAKGPYMDPTKVDPDKNNWSPTVGIAWSPSATEGLLNRLLGAKKTVIRTGYQIGYDSFFNNIASNAKTATPNVIATLVNASAFPMTARGVANWSTLLPTVARQPLPNDSQTLMPKNLVNPYTQRWSFGVQRELPAMWMVDISYVGSKGTRLYANEDMNPQVPSSMRIMPSVTPTLYAVQPRFDAAQGSRLIRTNGGSSIYHSLQMLVDRRFSRGMMIRTSYTWSKMIDNASEIFGVGNTSLPQNTALPSMYGGLTWDRSVSFFDRTHRASFTYIYQLPFMKEQKGFLGRVVGGWQVGGLTTFETGVPLNVYNGVDADGIGGNYDRPLFNPSGQPGVRAQISSSSATGYVNPEAGNAPIDKMTAMYIQLPAQSGALPAPTGNLGRNTLRMPGLNNWNMNFSKSVRTIERVNVELRGEFYNVWNHPQFGTGSVSPFSPGGGSMASNVATSLAGRFLNKYYLDGGGRVIRYQLRVTF